ncbi:hypothetical protein ACFQHN_10035 [Natrialbaceae archaeon GCM10025896]
MTTCSSCNADDVPTSKYNEGMLMWDFLNLPYSQDAYLCYECEKWALRQINAHGGYY